MFYVPHSRHSAVKRADIELVDDLEILAESPEAGVYIASSKNGRLIFITGHPEYDALSLKAEYDRYCQGHENQSSSALFSLDDPTQPPLVNCRSHANLLFTNRLNYHVYQETPYDLDELK